MAFPAQLHAFLSQIAQDPRPVRVFHQDESRMGLLPILRRRLTRGGVKPLMRYRHRFEWLYLYGAVEALSGAAFFLEMPRLDSLCFQVFLERFSQAYPESLNVVVLDNGAFHKSSYVVVPENVLLVFLPAYAPELNPIERLWQDIKEQLSMRLFATVEALKRAITEVLCRYTPTMIASLCGAAYVLDALNALH